MAEAKDWGWDWANEEYKYLHPKYALYFAMVHFSKFVGPGAKKLVVRLIVPILWWL